MRYWLKNCPRCQGDLREEADRYGSFISCVQCGYIPTEAEEARLLMLSAAKGLALGSAAT